MDETITCPNCGEINPADMPYCRSCQWRLRSLDEELGTDAGNIHQAGADANSPANQTKSAVPDWLKQLPGEPRPGTSADEAAAARLRERLGARDVEELVTPDSPSEQSDDLLAGLTRAEQPDDEPIPDWVARIMGISEADDGAAVAGAPAEGFDRFGGPGQSDGAGPGRPTDGARRAYSDFGAAPSSPFDGSTQSPDSDAASAGSQARGRESGDIYEWLRQLDANNAAPSMPVARRNVSATTDVPTWVGRMMGVAAEDVPETPRGQTSVPEWLKHAPTTEDELESAPPVAIPPSPAPGQRAGAQARDQALDSTDQPGAEWQSPPVTEPGLETRIGPDDEFAAELANDLVTESAGELGADETIDAAIGPPAPHLADADAIHGAPGSSAVSEPDALDVDAVFAAMEMPPWPSPALAGSPGESSAKPPAAHDDEAIQPAELPTWVQAMRPVETSVAAPESKEPVLPREAGGPLLGLQGVLPSIPGAFLPSGHPEAQAMRMEVSEQHRSQARLLEEMLEAETRPLPLPAARNAGESRVLRWLVAAVLLACLGLGLTFTSNSFVMPAGIPSEANAAVQVVQDLAPDAAVLAVFDYEPATAGEMEVTAASIMDHLLLLKHPRVALLSTSPTGSALAEHFLSVTLEERAYARGQQYANLGFLPGGLSGVRLFAQDPLDALPYGAATDRVWDSQVLRGIGALTNFGAILILTDTAEGGAVWIEQTADQRGSVPMVLISSAQAGPMLLPYFDSGQVQGLVAGMNGAAGPEIANGGRPGLVRRYWDAYNLGLYAAALLIILGAFWQIVGGVRRRAEPA